MTRNRELDYKKIVELYNSGISINKVAKLLRCRHNSVRYVLRQEGVEIRDYTWYVTNRIDRKKVVELYNLGYSQKKVAETLGCNKKTVFGILRKEGVKARAWSHYDLDKPLHVTKRIAEVILLRRKGLTYKQIGAILGICKGTVSILLRSAYREGFYEHQMEVAREKYRIDKAKEAIADRKQLLETVRNLSPRMQRIFAQTFPEYETKC